MAKKGKLTGTQMYRSIRRLVVAFQEAGGEPDQVTVSPKVGKALGDNLTTIRNIPVVVDDTIKGDNFAVRTTKAMLWNHDNMPEGIRFSDQRLNP